MIKLDKKYWKKAKRLPKILDVIYFDDDIKQIVYNELCGINQSVEPCFDGEIPCIVIPTLEGEMKAHVGDWIILGTKGELYPCKPDIFKEIYEIVGKGDDKNG